MPIYETERHPYIQAGENIIANKMIIGTFPIYSLTNPRTPRKNQFQEERNDISFFYGSRSNYFWSWYELYIDHRVNIYQPASILASLQEKQIAISDVISQCTRKDDSFKDSDLKEKQWNIGLAAIIEDRIEKIVCTSKADTGAMGWLRDRILLPAGFTLEREQSFQLHQCILRLIPQSNLDVKLVAQVLRKGDKLVEILSLPSPGSPSRRLVDFGCRKGIQTTKEYLDLYLTNSFNWFTR